MVMIINYFDEKVIKGNVKSFDVGVPTISKHLKNIFEEQELDKDLVVSKMEITADDEKNYRIN